MATSNARVAHSFAHGEKTHRNGSNFFWREIPNGRVIYSFGTHFALAAYCEKTDTLFINAFASKYSVSTARHLRHVLRASNAAYEIRVVNPLDFIPLDFSTVPMAERKLTDKTVESVADTFSIYAKEFAEAYKKATAARSNAASVFHARKMKSAAREAASAAASFDRLCQFVSDYAEKTHREWIFNTLEKQANASGERYAAAHAFYALCALFFQSDEWKAQAAKLALICENAVETPIWNFCLNAVSHAEKLAAREAARANETDEQRAQRNAKREAKRAAREAKKREAEREKLEKARAEFLSGARSYISGGAAILRVSRDGKRVETSQGYTVEITAENLRTLRTLLSAFESGRDISQRVKIGETVFDAKAYGKEYRALSIGCHVFALSEIDNYRGVIASAGAAI